MMSICGATRSVPETTTASANPLGVSSIATSLADWVGQSQWKLAISLGLIVLYITVDRLASPLLTEGAENSRRPPVDAPNTQPQEPP